NSPPTNLVHCKLCNLSFSSRNKLFQHLRLEHGHNTDCSEFSKDAQGRSAASKLARSQLQNLNHETYYRIQCTEGNLMSLEELDKALKFFKTPLPVTFRLLSESGLLRDEPSCYIYKDDARHEYARYLRDLGKGDSIRKEKVQGESQHFLEASPYFDPSTVQVAAVPPREWTEAAQRALSDAQDVGAVNRQELSSMVPPILLLKLDENVKSSHTVSNVDRMTVLDLCAAPGSKTLQLMDLLHSSGRTGGTSALHDDNVMLVANDSNRNRLLTLARRSRLAPARSCLLLNSSDGRYFPSLRKWGGYKLKFDRILVDVPCSGDGTLRKLSSKEWDKWNVLSHLQLHKLQVRLLVRALQSVKKGGRVVYSTCSLDPIENEAVVVSAIAQLGGPDVYKIMPVPKDFALGPGGTTKPLRYAAGATKWIVPHPQFSHENQTVYHRVDQVPEHVRKKHIVPTMFSPGSRICGDQHCSSEAAGQHVQKREDSDTVSAPSDAKDEGALERFEMAREDAVSFDDMLPNCCRILPQHLDSGGFFCAIIERSSPSFYSICCPRLRGGVNEEGEKILVSKHHGRIYHPVESAQQIREMVADEKAQGEEIYFEGHATLKGAVQWLHQHGAYIEGSSDSVIPVPVVSVDANSDRNSDEVTLVPANKKAKTLGETNPERQPLYVPLFQKPHQNLLAEFCEFYGLLHDHSEAKKSGVFRFPAEDVVIMGGGSKAASVTTCVSLEDDQAQSSTTGKRYRQQKFLRLTLVSKEIQSLHAGAAKFNPTEAGLSLSWVPVVCTEPMAVKGTEKKSNAVLNAKPEDGNPLSRGEKSGRYGLPDEAADFIGRCATRRVVDLAKNDFILLLESSSLKNPAGISSTWSDGGVVARYKFKTSKKVFASCKLQINDGVTCLELMMDRRTADSWLRLLRHSV
ncbi:MAG: hypothetical protein SGILL_006172, partial [Bacillariaceae sp.]